MTNPANKLFSEFSEVTNEAWQSALRKALKGNDPSTLEWSQDGITMEPFLRQEVPGSDSLPGATPFRRGNQTTSNRWLIVDRVSIDSSVDEANKSALKALWQGSEALHFEGTISDRNSLETLLHEILIDIIPLDFATNNPLELVDALGYVMQSRQFDPATLKGNIGFDPIGHLAFTGNWPDGFDANWASAKRSIRLLESNLPTIKLIRVEGHRYSDAGATLIEELAFTLAQASEYIAQLSDAGLPVASIIPRIGFTLGSGPQFFSELAKIRAFRMLWSKVVEAYNPSVDGHANIRSVTSGWTMTAYDAWTNMLRGTSQAMSSVIGGCDSLYVRPYDSAVSSNSELGTRIARNVSHLLREESWLDKVADPAGGSRYIEALTNEIARESWLLFRQIESEGGFLDALQNGTIQAKVREAAKEKRTAVEDGSMVFVGVNKYPNPSDTVGTNLTDDFRSSMAATTDVAPIPSFRATAAMEQARQIESSTTETNA